MKNIIEIVELLPGPELLMKSLIKIDKHFEDRSLVKEMLTNQRLYFLQKQIQIRLDHLLDHDPKLKETFDLDTIYFQLGNPKAADRAGSYYLYLELSAKKK